MHYSFKSVFSSVSYLQQTTKAPLLLFERFTLPVICSILQYTATQPISNESVMIFTNKHDHGQANKTQQKTVGK